jgi:hypothetical protein
MGQFKQDFTAIEEIVEEHMTGFDSEIQKQFASLLTDCYYRFGIDQSENPERNEEVFNNYQKVESALHLGTNESIEELRIGIAKTLNKERSRTEKLMFFITAAMVSMILMVAYISTI